MKQITILCENNKNPVAAIAQLMGEYDINIEGMDFNRCGEISFLSLRADKDDAVLALLIEKGYNAIADDFVILQAENKPGELALLSRQLDDAGVGIRSLTLLETRPNSGLLSLATDDNEKVRSLFAERVVN